jgi:ATP-binding cassette subfamily F protein 3
VDTLLKDINFIINEGERVALVGINGAGKTTLFRIITGELLADEGQVYKASNKTFGYLQQNALTESSLTLFQEVYQAHDQLIHIKLSLETLEEKIHSHEGDKAILLKLNDDYSELRQLFESVNGYQYDSLVKGVLNGLGFKPEDYEKSVQKLSGGQKTRVALAKELIKNPDFLMLDEPTNHLDIDAITWLESFLQGYKGTILIISHDRFFLDQIVNKTIELEMGQAIVYQGNFSEFIVKKAHMKDVQEKHYDQQQKTIKQQEEVIKKLRSFNREKSIKRAESREKLLSKVERLDKPMSVDADMHLNLSPRYESGSDVMKVENLSKSFGHLHLFNNLNFEIKKGDHIGLIGDNGTGKSTLFKIINELVEADTGNVQLGAKVKIGYYDQEHQLLNPSNTLVDEISDAYPTLTQGEIRNVLASYLFKGDDAFKKVSTLSGGEKGRLTLVKLMLSEANFLILDEPTNHLDIVSKNILENALIGYQGTLLFISHDRYFVNRVANKILQLKNQAIQTYLGNYDDFLKQSALALMNAPTCSTTEPVTETKLNWMDEKAKKAERRKLETQFEKVELEIHSIEEQIEEIDEQLCDESVYTNHELATELLEQKSDYEVALETSYEEWESLHNALELMGDE